MSRSRTTMIGMFTCMIFLFAHFAGAAVSVKKENGNIILSNGKTELVFSDSKNFKIVSMRSGNHNLWSEGSASIPPWKITYKGPNGETPELIPQNGTYEGVEIRENSNSTTLVFTWQMVLRYTPTYPVKMYVTLADDSELAQWKIDASMPQDWVISQLEFPRIPVLRSEKEKMIIPSGWGIEYEMGRQNEYRSRYPSHAGGMQFLVMHNPEGAFYYATEDRGASGKVLKVNDDGTTATFCTEIIASEGWTKNGQFQLPWTTVTGYNTKGWTAAATEWYRPFTFTTEWGKKLIPERSIPQWLRNADMWIRPRNISPEIMDGVRKALTYYGKGCGIHWYDWHQIPYDTHYPDYFPAKEGFAEAVKEAQKLGAYVTPYINGRLWDPATESYSRLNGKDASCRKADGTLYTEVYGSKVPNTVTCPSSPIWQNIQKGLVDRIQSELGTNGVYIDQIAAAAPEACYAKNHPHPAGGGDFWHYAYRNLLTDMRANHLKKDNILTSEENAECYADLFDMLLVVNTAHVGVKMIPLFPIVYSDRVITSGFTYIPEDLTNGSFRYISMQSLLWGSQLGWVNPVALMKPEAKNEALFLKNLMLFRRNQHDLFLGGRYLQEITLKGDNPTRDIPRYEVSPVVRAAEWLSVDGKKVILVVNMDDSKHKVVLPDGKEVEVAGLQGVRINL
ncbi:DUF6259 domain-containing protein [Parabacteroides bouchesdurhonensis]|uniref:DUF6259 domain-containing protein n=1 Tax=Parabacteroides bouchesdurhonensis TaxID=1936995 RepID=UPI001F44DB88|nr:DUF6259 domain-containing protein [Parabacteroides bouchesdurhonensis]